MVRSQPGRTIANSHLLRGWLLALALCCCLSAEEPQNPRCLIINSYHPSYAWTDAQTQGILDSLAEAGVAHQQVAIEYLDAKRLPELAHGEAFAHLLESKYRLPQVGCVVVTDNAALDYCVRLRARLFAGIPLVFCGINGFTPAMLGGQRGITGIIEPTDIAGTLRLAMRLHPHARQVATVYDQTDTGRLLRQEFDQAWQDLGTPLPCRHLTDLTYPGLADELRRLDRDTIVLVLSFARDRAGKVLEQAEEAAFMRASCRAPIYAVHENRLGYGVIGGMVLRGRDYGANAGRVAALILSGRSADDIQIERGGSSQPIFDQICMEEWGITAAQLPPGSRIINQPHSLWNDYRQQTLIALAVLALLMAIITALGFSIAARRRTARRLAASERLLEDSQRASLTGSFSLDLAAGIFQTSRTIDTIFGIDPGHPHTIAAWLDLVHEDDREAVRCHFTEEVLGLGRPFDRIYRARCDGGSTVKWLHGLGRLDRGPDGKPLRMIGTVQDVTRRIQAEEALRSSELRFREVLDNLPIPIGIVDRQGRLVLFNQAFTQRYGWDTALVPTIAEWWRLAYPDDAYRSELMARWAEVIAAADRDRTPTPPVEVRLTCRDGSARLVEVVVRTHGDLLVASFQDVTERKQAQDVLKEAAAQWQTTFDAVRDPLWLLDAEQRIRRSNRAADELAARLGEGAVGRHCWEVAHQADQAICDCPVMRARRSRRRESGEVRLAGRLYEVVADPVLDASGAFTGCVHLISDITEMRRMEESLRHTEKMNAIGQLAGGVAHDFNNQLGGIMGYAELLLRRIEDPALERYAQGILTAAQRSADLTRQLLAFARKGRYLKVAVDLHAVIAETAGILAHAIDPRIRIERRCLASSAQVLGDPSQLQNALLNLGLNARDAMESGGTLVFATAQIHVGGGPASPPATDLPAGGYLQVQVSDTGCGMSDEVRAHLFEPFFTTKGAGKGTGMGLAAVYGTIRNHGGAIAVDTRLGQGTTFTLLLPLAPVATEGAAPAATMVGPTRPLRVLVVDDESVMRNLLGDLLRSDGHSVISAADGHAGVELYREGWREIDLILLDMVMPTMDGLDCFRAMRAINPAARVLIASGFSLEGQAQALAAEGVLGFLSKPFQLQELRLRLALA
ncbi:MAG: PAS domain S-box protein [Planctomycetes bacterium]|nr:PAS domain S-box protein [Planctomycetota bacterium]